MNVHVIKFTPVCNGVLLFTAWQMVNVILFDTPFCYPFWGCCGGKAYLKLIALVISYYGNPKIRCDTVFSLDHFNINKSPFHCPYVVTPFGVAGRGKASREIACIGHSVIWEP